MRSNVKTQRSWPDAIAEMFVELTPTQRLIAIFCATACVILWLCH